MKKLVLLTDMRDIATTEVVLRSTVGLDDDQHPLVEVVNVADYDTVNAEFCLRLLIDSLSDGDIITVVCDPRLHNIPHDSLGVRLKNGVIVLGPNNGVMSWVISDIGYSDLVELPSNPDSRKHPTFNGKYKFAVATNILLKGGKLVDTGEFFDGKKLYLTKRTEGKIVHIDNYGNLKINHSALRIETGRTMKFTLNGDVYDAKQGVEFWDVNRGELIVYQGSSLWGLPEVAVAQGSAAKMLNAKIGDVLEFDL